VYRLADSVGDPPSATPTRVAVDETAVRINRELSWVYAAIDLDTKVLLDVTVFGRRGTDPAAAFLHGLTQKYDCSEAVFLVDGFGYLTAHSVRIERSARLRRPKPHRKVVSYPQDADRPLSFVMGRQSAECPLVTCVVCSLL
jgi:transposase-like protein